MALRLRLLLLRCVRCLFIVVVLLYVCCVLCCCCCTAFVHLLVRHFVYCGLLFMLLLRCAPVPAAFCLPFTFCLGSLFFPVPCCCLLPFDSSYHHRCRTLVVAPWPAHTFGCLLPLPRILRDYPRLAGWFHNMPAMPRTNAFACAFADSAFTPVWFFTYLYLHMPYALPCIHTFGYV